jgi:hypothetical protein
VRGVALVPVACLAAASAWAGSRAPRQVVPAPDRAIVDITKPASETCGRCHEDVYREWDPGLHHRSWTNPNILTATDAFAKTECRPCHSPRSVFETGLEQSPHVYRQPAFRPENVESGVHCLSCHGLPDGAGVAATRDVPDAPCRPRRDERLASVALCSACHDPTHQATQEYWTSAQAAQGVRCQDCHMAHVERGSGRPGRSHVFPGGFNWAQVIRGLHAETRLDGRDVVVTLTNNAAHKLPGEVPSRSLTISVEAFDAKGARVLDHQTLLRRPFKTPQEKDRVDDRLKPGETRTLRERLPDGAVRAAVSVVFRSLPMQPESRAIVVAKTELATTTP